ncbi:MAG: GIY-YIG nuclease family protein [Tissierellia bacterium]|nr:GIY-YIG nuclease family protein [Tissierellia bacterium]
MDKYYVYILRCADNTLYTGIAKDYKNRLDMHNAGKASKYTRGRLPVEIVYLETQDSKGEALKREYAIKKLTKKQKIKLLKKRSNF